MPVLPESVLASSVLTLTPKAVAMAPGLGGPPAGRSVANPVIRICFSVARGLVLVWVVELTILQTISANRFESRKFQNVRQARGHVVELVGSK